MTKERDGVGQNSGTPPRGPVGPLVAALSSEDGSERQRTRERLVEIGEPAVPALVIALKSPGENTRWEAAKALGAIRDPRAASALVDALEDAQPAVRWLAAKALIALDRGGLEAVLRAVERSVGDVWLREGVIQVLHALVREGIAPEASPVLEALEGAAPAIEAPVAAYRVLQSPEKRSG